MTYADPDVIRRVLHETATWAVVGLGNSPDRPAYRVAAFLQALGERIVPVHPTDPEVLGERSYPSLLDIPFPVDVVNVFRRPELAGRHADEAVRIGARALWLQLGVIDEAAAGRAAAAGLDIVMDRCPAIEWPRLAAA